MQEIADILESLSRVPGMLAALVKDIPPERMAERRGEGCWTILEHLAHLAEVQPMLSQRFKRLIVEDVPEFVPFDPGKAGHEPDPAGRPASQLVQAMAGERCRQLEILRSLAPEAWERKGSHPEYTDYGLRIAVRHMLLHDLWHMYRIEELWLLNDVSKPH